MRFRADLISGTLVRRYKRFLADVDLGDRSRVTVHCPNTGSMMGCCQPGSPVWLSRSDNGARKYPYTWELVQVDRDTLVGINTGITSRLVREAVENGVIQELRGYTEIESEVKFGTLGSRVDLVLRRDGAAPCYVEIKNVTAAVDSSVAVFPDAVSSRATKHLLELMTMAAQGARAVLCYCVQRDDVARVQPADAIDPEYGRILRRALSRGVEAVAYRARVSTGGIELYRTVPVTCP